MKRPGRQHEPFMFHLIQALSAGENVHEDDFRPVSALVLCLLMVLAGAAAALYGYTFGPLSQP